MYVVCSIIQTAILKGETLMEQKKLDRISELYRKSKTAEGLTEQEKAEQKALRDEYRAGFKRCLVSELENCVIVDEHGNRKKVKAKDKK